VSDPIKLIFLASGTNEKVDSFARAVDERVVYLCREFYRKRGNLDAVLPAPAVLRFVNFHCQKDAIKVFDFKLSTGAKPRPPATMKLPKGKDRWERLADFPAPGDADFSPAGFVDARTPLTMVNVYHSVRDAPPKSILELSIFSHAFEEGPNLIVADGNDDFPPKPINGLPIRNPDPKDVGAEVRSDTNARARTDFEPNMGEDPTLKTPGQFPRGKDALKEFKAAFDPRASFIVFGCNGKDSLRNQNIIDGRPSNERIGSIDSTAGQVLNQAYVKPLKEYQRKLKKKSHDAAAANIGAILASGKVPGDQKVPIDMGEEFDSERREIDKDIGAGRHHHSKIFDENDRANDKEKRREAHYGLDPGFFTTNDLRFAPKWSSILGFVARRTQKTYAFVAASKLVVDSQGVDVISGPVGTKAAADPKGKQLAVCGGFALTSSGDLPPDKSTCTRKVRFHETFMRTSPHPKSELERRYFVYDAATIAHINSLANNK
jgi:hypothetical protein